MINFKIWFVVTSLWIVQESNGVTQVLSGRKDAAQLTWANTNFFASHPYKWGIGNLQVGDDRHIWSAVHKSLAKSVDRDQLKKIMVKHKRILFGSYGFRYELNNVLEEYILRVWGEYCFGPHIDHNKYARLQKLVIGTLRLTFYENRSTIMIPVVGRWISKFWGWWYRNNFFEIDALLEEMLHLEGVDGSFFGKFKENLAEQKSQNEIDVDQIVRDNAFLSPLVFDFLYIYLMEAMVQTAKKGYNHSDRLAKKREFLDVGYLFPYRFRRLAKDVGEMTMGDFAVVNLVKANKHFSSGPRSCIGPGFVDTFYATFMEMFEPFTIVEVGDVKITRNCDPNVPIIVSRHIVELSLPRDYLREHMSHCEHKGVAKFWDTNWIDKKPTIKAYVNWKMYQEVLNLANVNAIVTPDARGFLYGAALQELTSLPLHVVRKQGKLPGKVWQATVRGKAYDKPEVIDMATDESLRDSRVVVVDDGMASGATMNAIQKLLEQNGVNNVIVLVAIHHTYTECTYDGEVFSVFDL